MADQGKRSKPARLVALIGAIFVWCLLIGLRLVHLQVLLHDKYAAEATQNQQMTQLVSAPRGVIYDAHMYPLATNVAVNTVVVEPPRIEPEKIAPTARKLASILNLNAQELYAKMSDPARRYIVVKRRIDPLDEGPIVALGSKGVYLVEESMRVYPNRELGCHALGFVNMNGDGDGADGVEMQYDKELKGTKGEISFEVDARRRSFQGQFLRAPVQGHSLVLSIDKSIQYIAERELEQGVTKHGAANGIAVVMESDTGRILALANYPGFNGNAYNQYPADVRRNRAISDFIEPGSTFKVVVASAALEAGVTQPDAVIDCQMGSITVHGHVFHDHNPYGMLTFGEILEKSSNIGAAKLGMALGEERLYGALRTFGFGSRTGIDLPGEIIGLVRDYHKWSGLSVAAISFGQEVGVTSMQILDAINAIANGGYRIRPSIVDRIIDHNGDLVRATQVEKTRIMRPETAAVVRDAFEGVVLRGTGKKAALDGYRAAGKTGTAQKIVDGHYSSSKYVASFIGFAPLPAPRITVLVQINEPHGGIYGGDVSAPVFKAIAQETLLQLGVPPDRTLPVTQPKVDPTILSASADFKPNATPAVETRSDKDTANPNVITVRVAAASVSVPDFTGMSKRAAVERAQELGLRIQISGTGAAITQTIAPGTLVPAGETCGVTFSQEKPARGHVSPAATGNLIATGSPDAKKR